MKINNVDKINDIDYQKIWALLKSIWKWVNITFLFGRDLGVNNCSLCLRYIKSYNHINFIWTCHGCPVYLKTRHNSCNGTPYRDFKDKEHTIYARFYALKELIFLISLLFRRESWSK